MPTPQASWQDRGNQLISSKLLKSLPGRQGAPNLVLWLFSLGCSGSLGLTCSVWVMHDLVILKTKPAPPY